MNIEKLIHIMNEDYGFTFSVNFGMKRNYVHLHICKKVNNPREKVAYFMNTLLYNDFIAERNEEEEETIFRNADSSIRICIADE